MANKPSVSRKAIKVAPAKAGAKAGVKAPAQAGVKAPAQAVAPAQTTPQSITAVVAKIGWDNGNERIPVVLLDRKQRAQIGVEEQDLALVTKGDKSRVAFVHKQFWELVGSGKVTINGNLAQAISADMENEVVVSKPSEEQRAEFQRAEQARMATFLSNVFGRIAQAHEGDGE